MAEAIAEQKIINDIPEEVWKEDVLPYVVKKPLKLLYCIPIDKLEWTILSYYPNAIHILEKNKEKINWSSLSGNPNAIHLLENNMDKIDWGWLSDNPNAMHILENHIHDPDIIDEIDWYYLCKNPSIFTYDKKKHFQLIDEYYYNWIYTKSNTVSEVLF